MTKVKTPLHTPYGRYIIALGRLWHATDPHLLDEDHEKRVADLMKARRAIKAARTNGDPDAEPAAHRGADAAKHGLGERGPVWWDDRAPGLSRRLVKNTLYAE